jgi:hypothetical protein
MNKILLAIVMVVILSITARAQELTTKWWSTPIYNNLDNYISTSIQGKFSTEALIAAILRDVRNGDAALIPAGTKVMLFDKTGKVCFIYVEGFSGIFCTDCEAI